MLPASKLRPCQSPSASSSPLDTCISPPSSRTSSFFLTLLINFHLFSIISLSTTYLNTLSASSSVDSVYALISDGIRKCTVEPSSSLLPQTHYFLHSVLQSHSGSSISKTPIPSQVTLQLSPSSQTPVIYRTRPVRIHKSILAHNSHTDGAPSRLSVFSSAPFRHTFLTWLLPVRSQSEFRSL